MGKLNQSPAYTAAILAVAVLFLTPFAMAQQSAPAPGAGDNLLNELEEPPREMTITGQRLFRHLREEIHEAEDHMYGLFNELNDDDMLDISCEWHAELGTRIRQRSCQPEFVRQAREGQAENFIHRVQGSGYANVNPPAMSVLGHYSPILEQRMKELIRESPEFFEAIQRHHALREELNRKKSNFFSDE